MGVFALLVWSPSSRRAWIEIEVDEGDAGQRKVALLAEGVDRNQKIPQLALVVEGVALLAEGVDRNFCAKAARGRSRVALLAEGVDRNPLFGWIHAEVCGRPPRGGRG